MAFWLGHLVTQHMLLSLSQSICASDSFPPFQWSMTMDLGTTHYLQNVVAWAVAEVPHANLCAHVPATEGAASELQASNLQQHVGDRRKAVPLQVQVLEPLVPGQSKYGNDG